VLILPMATEQEIPEAGNTEAQEAQMSASAPRGAFTQAPEESDTA